MRKALQVASLLFVAAALVACSSDNGSKVLGGADTGTGAADGATDGPATDGVVINDRGLISPDASGIKPGTSFPQIPAGESVECNVPAEQKHLGEGRAYPVTGLNAPGADFTCTTCPKGLDWLNGRWMFFENVPGDAPFVEIFEFDGNTFTNVIVGEDKDLAPGKVTTMTMHGYYFCPSKAEYASLRKVFVVLAVDPPGAFGNKAGDNWPCDILEAGDVSNSFLLWCDFDWDGTTPMRDQYQYCRENEMYDGVACDIP
jgi:hypothetical protein